MKKNITIMCVEQNDSVREETISYLSLFYIKVLEARTGEEALKLYYEYRPDIIITEIDLPVLDGLELVKSIRRQDTETAIIFVTTLTDSEVIIDAIELQLVKYIVKPLTNHKLDSALTLAHKCLNKNGNSDLIALSPDICFNKINHTLTIHNDTIYLTHNEVLLLSLLADKPNLIVSYQEIKRVIWNYEITYKDSLRSLIRSLRSKLDTILIKNISGVGYSLILNSF